VESLGLTEPLDFESDVPVFSQIANRLKFAIARGAYAPNAQLPSVRALAKALVVNPNTVIRVYHDLELEGLIYTHQGKGVFVSPGALRRCRRERVEIVEEKLGEAVDLARKADVGDAELDELWKRAKSEGTGRTS
jgi:GntR family transcriptional regulator